MIAEFETEAGNTRAIIIPLDCGEISFADFCDYRGAELEFFQVNKEGIKEDEELDENLAVRALTKAVAVIAGDSVYSVPFAVKGDNLTGLLKQGYQIVPGDRLTVLRLYAHITVLIQSFKPREIPNNFKFTHGGKKFYIEWSRTANILAKRPMSTGETIEMMELQRRAAYDIKASPRDGGNLEFTLGLTEFAILVRQKGEQLPSDPAELEAFLDERKKLFATLPLDAVLSIRFFLLNALIRSAQKETSGTSGKARLRQTKVKKLMPRGRTKRRRKKPGR